MELYIGDKHHCAFLSIARDVMKRMLRVDKTWISSLMNVVFSTSNDNERLCLVTSILVIVGVLSSKTRIYIIECKDFALWSSFEFEFIVLGAPRDIRRIWKQGCRNWTTISRYAPRAKLAFEPFWWDSSHEDSRNAGLILYRYIIIGLNRIVRDKSSF